MNLCAKTEYACLAMVELARRHASGAPAPVREIAVAQRIPEKFLVQILHRLKSAGLVVDRRDAQWVRYRRNPALSPRIVAIIDAVIAAMAAERKEAA